MVNVVSGASLGLDRSSGSILGDPSFGLYGENVTVNGANGNLIIERVDEILAGKGPDDTIARAYNSLSNSTGYGTNNGWQTNDGRNVWGLTGTVNTAGSSVNRTSSDGTVETYNWSTTASAYICTQAGHAEDRLTFSSGANTWTWTDGKSRVTEVYDGANSGRLTTVTDANGNSLTFTYTGALLTQVTTASGEYTTLTYTGSNLTQISTHLSGGSTVTRVDYTYDGQNRLSTVVTDLTPGDNSITDGATVVTTYGYSGTTNRITSISQTGGAQLTIAYTLVGSNYCVSSLTQTLATGVTSTTSFSYPSTGTTTITDNNGKVTTLTYDTLGQLTNLLLPPAQSGATAQSISYTYDSHGNMLTATDAAGYVTTYTYDGNDNLLTVTDPLSNVATYTYDTNNHVLTKTNSGTTAETARFAYDTAENLRFAITGDGQVTQYIYNSAGQQTSAITYTDNIYNLTGLNSSTAPSLSTMTTWASGLSDLSTIKRVDTTYDFRGNIATVTTYSACSTAGAGLTTSTYTVVTYVYDPSGLLLSKQTSGVSHSEVFTYDGLWRTTSAVDLNGGTTTIAFNNTTNTTVVTSPNGLTTTSVHDLAGRLISVAKSGTGLTTATVYYAYDNLGRLGMVTDATANKSYFLYDAVGRKVADIAADGSITEYRYDADNNLVATITYATKLTTTQLNSLVSSGSPTNPALSTVRPSSASGDVWTWRIYDHDSRLIESIDGDGDATVYAYDTFSNLISVTSYANLIASGTITGFKTTLPTSITTPTANANADRVTRNFYNNENQIIAKLDGNGYLTQTFYNGVGDITKTIASVTQVPSAHRAAGALSQLITDVGTSARDITTIYVYDDQDHLRYTVNSNLYPTEYVYDAAGHVVTTLQYAGAISAPSSYTVALVAAAVTTAGLASNTNTRKSYAVYNTTTGNLDYTINAVGDVTQYRYDSMGNVVKVLQFVTLDAVSSLPTQATMDSWATTHASDTGNRITRSIYNLASQLVYSVDGENYVTEYRYDTAGRVTLQVRYISSSYTITDSTTPATLASQIGTIPGTAVQTSYSYDVDGRISDSYDGLGIQTHYVYDAQGRLTDKSVAYGTSDVATTHFVYDAANHIASQTMAYGTSEAATTSYTYDGQGRVLTITDPRSHATTYTYDGLGDVLTVTDATGAVTTNTYDAFGNLLTSTDPLSNVSYYFYDKLNRVVLALDPLKYATATTYTIGNEIASVVHYVTAVTGTITAGVAPTVTTNANDATTTFTRNNIGQVTQATDAGGYSESFAYNAFGNVTSHTNKLGGVTTYTYDRRGLKLSEILPESSVRANGTTQATSVTNTFTYDSRGNRTQMVEASGLTEARTTNYTYDKLNRLTQTSGDAVTVYSSTLTTTSGVTPTTVYTYDNRGNVIKTVDPSGAAAFFYYDHLNRKIEIVNALGAVSTWTYDANGNVLTSKVYTNTVTLPTSPGGTPPTPSNPTDCRQTTYTYDNDNRVLTTTVASVLTGAYSGSAYATTTGNVVVTDVYDANGNLVKQTDPNGNSVFSYYDKLGNKIAEADQNNYFTTWSRDPNGNVLTETRYKNALSTTPTTTSNPTTLAAGITTTSDDRITNFTYDKNGNRLTETRTGVVSYSVNSTNGALTTGSTSSTITYTYNGLGEVTTQTQATGDAKTYTYDSMGRQTLVKTSSYTGIVAGSSGTVQNATALYYDGLNNLSRSSVYDALNGGTTAQVTTFTYGAGGRLATMTDPTGFARTYGYDANGRTMMVSYTRHTSNGTAKTEAQAYQYDALGRQTQQTVATYSGAWSFGDTNQTQYNAYGDISATGINGVWEGTYTYDNAGRLVRTTAKDGTVQMFLYDAAGNRTLEIDPTDSTLASGYSWSTITLANALTILTNSGANAVGAVDMSSSGLVVSFTTYDKRAQITGTVQPFRQLSPNGSGGYNTTTITTAKTYNAFGDVASATDGRGNTTNYTYSTLGKMRQQVLPSVSYTSENGTVSSASPTTTYYYDIAGREIGFIDPNGNTTTWTNLANTGYQGASPTPGKQFNPDGGISTNAYDVFGNLIQATNQIGQTTVYGYDAMNRATSQANPSRGSVQLIDYYAYDELGQRTQSWNNQLGSSAKATTDYDAMGRIIQTTDMAGNATTYAYAWSASYATSGLGTFGGWLETTTMPSSDAMTVTVDPFGRTIGKTTTPSGGATTTTTYTFDGAGRLVTQANNATAINRSTSTNGTVAYTYYNTGHLATESETYTGTFTNYTYCGGGSTYHSTVTAMQETMQYDANGNVTAETVYNAIHSVSSENATASYDALNRMTSYSDTGYHGTNTVSESWQYDLNSNVRRLTSNYEDDWYKYDAMNRVVTNNGRFVGTAGSGSIDRGPLGTDYGYDAAGNRVTSTTTHQWTSQTPAGTTGCGGTIYTTTYNFQAEENLYTYTADGYLSQINVATGTDSTSSTSTYIAPAAASGSGTVQATYTEDAMGRITAQTEYDSTGTNVLYQKTQSFDAASNVTSDYVKSVRPDGTWEQWSNYYYTRSGSGGGAYMGALTDMSTTVHKNTATQPSTRTQYSYAWNGSEKQSQIIYTPNTSSPGTTYTTTNSYDPMGNLQSAYIADGTPRTIAYDTDIDGHVRYNTNSAGPSASYYFFNGVDMAETTNDGANRNLTTSQSIAYQTQVPGSGYYQNGATSGTTFRQFGTSIQQINGINNGNTDSTSPTYTVVAGDTLQSIAQALWGNSNFWYLIAQANGLSGNVSLANGQTLIIPSNVVNGQNSSSTTAVYNPSQALGSTMPTHPPAPKPPAASHSSGGCGIMGQILLIVVAIAVSIVAAGAGVALLGGTSLSAGIGAVVGGTAATVAGVGTVGAIAIGAAAGALGSIVSQGIGVATGLQSSFNWKAVGLAAIGGGVGAGLGGVSAFGKLGDIGGAIARGVVGNVVTQGIGVATGLQSKFDWAGVAAAGISAGVMAAVGPALGYNPKLVGTALDTIPNDLLGGVTGMAGDIAGAATRSLLDGSDFGDNIMRALPDVIGQTIGNIVAGKIATPATQTFVDDKGTIAYTPPDSPLAPMTSGIEPSIPPTSIDQGGLLALLTDTSSGTSQSNSHATTETDPSLSPAALSNSSIPLSKLTPEDRIQALKNAIPVALQGIANTSVSLNNGRTQVYPAITSEQLRDFSNDSAFLNSRISSGAIDVKFETPPGYKEGAIAAGADVENGTLAIYIDPGNPYLFKEDGTVNYSVLESKLVHEGEHLLDAVQSGRTTNPSTIDEERGTEQHAYTMEAIFNEANPPTSFSASTSGNRVFTVNGHDEFLSTPNANDVAELSVQQWVIAHNARFPDSPIEYKRPK